jgi:hypothetical protein
MPATLVEGFAAESPYLTPAIFKHGTGRERGSRALRLHAHDIAMSRA